MHKDIQLSILIRFLGNNKKYMFIYNFTCFGELRIRMGELILCPELATASAKYNDFTINAINNLPAI